MFPAPSRRDVIQMMLAGAAGLALPRYASAQLHHSPLTASPLSDSVVLVSGGGGNVLEINGPDGVVMINGGSQERSSELLKMIADHSGGKRVVTLFNTDWQPDHTGSNDALGKSGTQIVAHENTKQYLANELFVEWEKRTYKARASQALPTKTFFTTGTMNAGAERLQY